jgi:hypothetical protein
MQSDKYSGELVLTPLELIHRIAQLVPPPRTHRHRYYGVLAPNSPLQAAVTAMAHCPHPPKALAGAPPSFIVPDHLSNCMSSGILYGLSAYVLWGVV